MEFLTWTKRFFAAGFVLGITALSTYSAMMSTYQHMVPAHMGNCALQRHHQHLVENPTTHPSFTGVLISKFYAKAHLAPPECQFPSWIPTAFTDPWDTPAQEALPFGNFCAFFGELIMEWLESIMTHPTVLEFGSIIGLALVQALIAACVTAVYLGGVALLNWVVGCVRAIMLSRVFQGQRRTTWFKKPTDPGFLILCLIFMALEGPHWTVEVYKNAKLIGPALFLYVFSSSFGLAAMGVHHKTRCTVPMAAGKGCLIATVFTAMILSLTGFRLFLFTGVVGPVLLLHIQHHFLRRFQAKHFPEDPLIGQFQKAWQQINQANRNKINKALTDYMNGNSTAPEAIKAISKQLLKVLRDYHPDKNQSPEANGISILLNGIREELEFVGENDADRIVDGILKVCQ